MRLPRVATAVLAGAMAVLAALIVRCAVLAMELGRGAPARDFVRLGLLAAVLMAAEAALALALRAPEARRANAALATATVFVTLYAAELVLGLDVARARKRREKLERIAALRAAGVDAYPGVDSVHFVRARYAGERMAEWLDVQGAPAIPLAGISRRHTVDCREGGGWLEYVSDEEGFHNPAGSWAGGSEIVFLGDSFVHGNCVPSDQNMVAWARRRVPAALNLGMAGAGPLGLLAALREYVPALRPRTVVWCHFTGNDLLDLRFEMRHPILRRYLEPGFTQGLRGRRAALDAALGEFTERQMLPLLERSARLRPDVARAARLGALRQRLGLGFARPERLLATEEEFAVFARVLEEARRTVGGWGGRLVVAVLPEWPQAPRQLGEAEYAQRKRAAGARARAIVSGLGLPLVDVERRFAAEADPLSLYACPGCHYSPRGYEVAAHTILDALDGTAAR